LPAAADLRLKGGQIAIQGIFDSASPRNVHAVTGGTGTYRNVQGESSFTEPAPGGTRHHPLAAALNQARIYVALVASIMWVISDHPHNDHSGRPDGKPNRPIVARRTADIVRQPAGEVDQRA